MAYSPDGDIRRELQDMRSETSPQAESRKGRTADALAPEGEEGRGKLRKAAGRCMRPLIRGCPNGATPPAEGRRSLLEQGGKRRELKHLSTCRKRKQE